LNRDAEVSRDGIVSDDAVGVGEFFEVRWRGYRLLSGER
jgi:hypothetical protein